MEFFELIQSIEESMPPGYESAAQFLTQTLPYLGLCAALLTCCLGYKMHHIWFKFLVFCIGFILGFIIHIIYPSDLSIYFSIALGLTTGVLGIIFSHHLLKIQLFVLNAFFVYSALPNLLSRFLPMGISIFIGLMSAIIVGILAVRYKFMITIITTSISGAILSAHKMFDLIQYNNEIVLFILIIILSVTGLTLQCFIEKEHILKAQERIVSKSKITYENVQKIKSKISDTKATKTNKFINENDGFE